MEVSARGVSICILGFIFVQNTAKSTVYGINTQTVKYVVRAEYLPRASRLPCAQNLENILEKYKATYVEALQGWLF